MMVNDRSRAEPIEAELIHLLFKQAPPSMVANALISAILVAVIWPTIPSRLGITWLLAIYAVIGVRLVMIQRFRRASPAPHEIQRWGAWSAASTLLLGLVWACAPITLLVPSESISLVTMTVILMGLAAGSAIALAPYMPSFYAFVVPSLGSFAVVLALDHATVSHVVAILATVALIAYCLHSRNVHRLLRHSLELSYENTDLRREAEQKTSLLESTLENISQGICAIDGAGGLTMWNQRFVRLLGLPAANVTFGGNLHALLLSVDAKLAESTFARAEYLTADERVVEILPNPRSGHGHVITYTDITPQKRREQALESARRVAEQANAAKTRFLAAASHDLRQPVHAIGLFFATLEERTPGAASDPLFERIRDAIIAVDTMLTSLLDISKLDAGVIHPVIVSVSVRRLFERLASEFELIARERGLRLQFRALDVRVQSDANLLDRVLRNLISNALRYTSTGGVLVAARRTGTNIRFCVYDTGIGIPAHEFEEIFVEFHQLDNPERDRQQGLGLGLAIVRRICDLLGHQIVVRSRLGTGSSFELRLPLATYDSSPVDTAHADHTSLTSCHILVLDDDQAVRQAMAGLLTGWGCTVSAVGSTSEAMACVRGSLAPDVLVVDYRLRNNESGIEAISAIHAASGQVIPALVITGDTAPERLREAERSGLSLLHKPVAPHTLRAGIERLLARTDDMTG